jgi:hypothetical protein
MTHLTLPSEVEPESLADLVADCRCIHTPHVPELCRPPFQPRPAVPPRVTIPDSTAALLDGMADYGD